MDKRNLELKQQLAASKEELSTKINDFEGRMKATAETNAMTVANLQRDVIAADDKAQLIEWDRDEVKAENEDLKKTVGDFATRTSNYFRLGRTLLLTFYTLRSK